MIFTCNQDVAFPVYQQFGELKPLPMYYPIFRMSGYDGGKLRPNRSRTTPLHPYTKNIPHRHSVKFSDPYHRVEPISRLCENPNAQWTNFPNRPSLASELSSLLKTKVTEDPPTDVKPTKTNPESVHYSSFRKSIPDSTAVEDYLWVFKPTQTSSSEISLDCKQPEPSPSPPSAPENDPLSGDVKDFFDSNDWVPSDSASSLPPHNSPIHSNLM